MLFFARNYLIIRYFVIFASSGALALTKNASLWLLFATMVA